MLAGVGGKTIAEAKENMSYNEALKWFDYMRRKGTIDLATRIEHGFAMLATLISNTNGGRSTMADFMMFEQKDSAKKEETASMGTVFLMLGGGKDG